MEVGNIVKWVSPMEDESPEDRFEVIEIIENKCDIRIIESKLAFAPINTVNLIDVELV